MTVPLISNDAARRIFLDRHALAEMPGGGARGGDLCDLIERLGFVQVDSIATVARAHDMILYSRRNAYRPKNLRWPLERSRNLFEHWTHDAAVLPVQFFPYWHLRFERSRAKLQANWQKWRDNGFEQKFEEVLRHISDHGPVCSAEVGADEKRSNGGWWDWHPSKTALEYLWRTGALSVTRREGFRKYYDLTERVIPANYARVFPGETETINWACAAALDRLGFATSGELAAFWDLIKPAEAKAWATSALAAGRVIEVDVAGADGGKPRRCLARPDLPDRALPEVPVRLRILSPFDPSLRDRKRAARLFGFHYRIEIFVPEAQRKFGYYVFPVIEGTKIIGRIDMKTSRKSEVMGVRAFWPEAGVKLGKARLAKLAAEIDRVARFAECSTVDYASDWLRGPEGR